MTVGEILTELGLLPGEILIEGGVEILLKADEVDGILAGIFIGETLFELIGVLE